MSEYKICRRCGAQLDPDDNFCMACGAPTSEDFLVAGSDLSGMPVGQVAPEAPSPEATVPVPAALDVVDESEGVVRSDGPATTWGGVDTAAIHEPVTSSALPAMDWGPSPEPSGVAPSGGNVDAPSGSIPASDVSSPPDGSVGAGASNMDGIASASASPFAFVPPDDGAVIGVPDAVGQAPVMTTSSSAADVPSVSADADGQWLAKALGIDVGPTPSASASPADVPAASVSVSGDDVSAASGGSPIPYFGASEPGADAPASSVGVPIMSADSRLTDDSPMPEASTAASVDSDVTRGSSKRKVAAGIGVALLFILAVLGFLTYKHSREEVARGAIVATAQSMVACDKGLQGLDGVAEFNHSYLLLDKTDTVKDRLGEASSSLDDAHRSLESAKSDGWALDDDERRALDVLQDGLDARRGMINSGSQLVSSLADVRSAAEELAHLMTDSSLFLGSSDNAVNALNSSSRYIDQIDTTNMANDLESAKKYQASMSDDLRVAREKLPSANLSNYQMTVDRAGTMVTALQDILDAIQAQDASRANDAATALNAAIDSFNDARRELPPLAEGIESLVSDSAKSYAKNYYAQRERVVETLTELRGNPLTRDVVDGSMFLEGSHV